MRGRIRTWSLEDKRLWSRSGRELEIEGLSEWRVCVYVCVNVYV